MKLRDIYFGFNLRGNRIINAKTNTPVNSDDIVPKNYVDVNKTYDTPTAQTHQNPPKFPWITNVYNKSFKQIFDDLFFPVINPTYINPNYYDLSIEAVDEYNISGSKRAIFEGRINQFIFKYKINPNDRISGFVPKVIIIDNQDNITEINGTETSDTEGVMEFSFLFRNIKEIIFRKEFQESPVIKNDNYGNPYIPVDFTLNYNLDFDLLNFINQKFNVYPPIVYYKLPIGTNPFSFISTINNGDSLENIMTLVKDRKFLINGNNNIYIIGIPEPLYTKASLKIYTDLVKSDIDLSQLDENFNGQENYGNLKDLYYYNKNVKYFFGYFDFGYFETMKTINLAFNINKS